LTGIGSDLSILSTSLSPLSLSVSDTARYESLVCVPRDFIVFVDSMYGSNAL